MKILSKIIIAAVIGIAGMTLASCNFLDVDSYFEDTFKEDSIFHSRTNAEGYLWNTPKDFPDPGAIWGDSWNLGEMASDEITTRWRTGQFSGILFTVGEINARNVPGSMNIWYRMYRIIRRCNTMLANVDGVADMSTRDRQLYKGYVHFLRGYAYYHLLMNWGPCLIVGDEVLPNSESAEYYDRERATYDESVDYICNEFALAAQVLPHPQNQSISYYERPTQGAALALIARLRLYQASPLFNGGDAASTCFGTWKRKSDGAFYVNQEPDSRRWAVAAAAAKSVIDLGFYELYTAEVDRQYPYPDLPFDDFTEDFPNGPRGIDPILSYHNMFNGEGIMQTNKEFIWAMPSSSVRSYTRHSFPVYYGGWGGMAVPQRVVNCYLMNDGRTFQEATNNDQSLQDPTKTIEGTDKQLGRYLLKSDVPKMYDNREARFYASIGFPGSYWPMNSALSKPDYAGKQFWFSAEDNSGIKGAGNNVEDYNVTGYTPVKYIHPDDSWAGNRNVESAFITDPKPFPIIRYAEVLLEYVEALDNVESDVTVDYFDPITNETKSLPVSRDTEEMKRYFNLIRYRAGLPGVEIPGGVRTFQDVIRNERQIELFNEGYRVFDTRRWGTYLSEDDKDWRGFNVESERTDANGKGGFFTIGTINTQNIRDRIVDPRMVLLPIPHDELLKVPAMDQNPGWER